MYMNRPSKASWLLWYEKKKIHIHNEKNEMKLKTVILTTTEAAAVTNNDNKHFCRA